MKNKLVKQYKGDATRIMAEKFGKLSERSVSHFRKVLALPKKKLKLLDVGFGEGTDLVYYEKRVGAVFGIDTSIDFINIVKNKNISATLKNECSENMSFKNNFFDVVVSKYVLQTLPSLEKTYNEIHRVLKKDGTFQFLIVHPMRQYFEKKNTKADYFKKEIIESSIFDGAFTVLEPSHTFQEIFSKNFLNKFNIVQVEEAHEFPAAEQIEGRWYPAYLIVKAKKK
jgi:ubiquinone/menaquinone biosynthesis C-methylase UbiE